MLEVRGARPYESMMVQRTPSLLFGLSAMASMIVACGGDPAPAPRVERAPAPVQAAAPPPVEEPPAAEEPEDRDVVMKAILLGERKKVEEVEAPPAEERPVQRVAKRRPAAPLEDEPQAGGYEPNLSDSEFQAAIGTWRGVQSCLATNAARSDDASGALRLSFTIRADGAVVHSKVVDASNTIAEILAPCVERQAKRLRFPAFAEAGEVTKVAKFVF